MADTVSVCAGEMFALDFVVFISVVVDGDDAVPLVGDNGCLRV
jgi:hypothetical protein